jgi:hypothetical protein
VNSKNQQTVASINEEYLKQNDWWWRRLVWGDYQDDPKKANAYHVLQPRMKDLVALGFRSNSEWKNWNEKMELVAYRYELARRVLSREENPPFPMLTIKQESFLKQLNENDLPIYTIFDPVNDSSEWSSPMLPWQWRLTASDKSLIDRFILYINEERRRNGLPDDVFKKMGKSGARKTSNAGNRNRGVSWRGLELLDIQFHKIHALKNNSETSTVSRLKGEAKQWSALVKHLLSQAARFQVGQKGDQGATVRRFLEENFRPYPE